LQARSGVVSEIEGEVMMNTAQAYVDPGGIRLDDAVKGLREAGYPEWRIWDMIEVVDPDHHGPRRWRWRTENAVVSAKAPPI
jgi:hypothetical protein